jgi:hypothetical protein
MLFDKILVEYIFRNFNENSEKQALLKNIRSTVTSRGSDQNLLLSFDQDHQGHQKMKRAGYFSKAPIVRNFLPALEI